MSLNWVMKDETAKRPFVPLPHERALLASPHRTALSLKSPKTTSSSANTAANADVSSSSGVAYITSRRVVYLPSAPTAAFQSFSVPLLNLHDTYVTAPWFGPNVVAGQVQPIRDGGLPTPSESPYMLELKLTFNEGGAYDFHSKFSEMRERLHQNREMVREIGDHAVHQELHGEQLPAYEERDVGAASNMVSQERAGFLRPGLNEVSASSPPGPPDEAPPEYYDVVPG